MKAFKKTLLSLGLVVMSSSLWAQGIAVTIDNQPVRFSGMGPRSVNGRVMVPLRGIFEALGAYVSWQSATQTVGATKGDVELSLRIGERIASVNGRDVLLDVPAQIINGSTMVP